VVYLVFNEGYSATGGDRLQRGDLCEEAVWLGRLLHRLVPDDSETGGLLALMLLHHARSGARQDSNGRPIPLAGQDRTRWDGALISEGTALIRATLARGAPGPYQIQAAIAAVHDQAQAFEQTDWAQIAELYAELARHAPSPVVEVNRAVAAGMAYGPRAGLAILAPVLASGVLEGYGPLHTAHADLLERLGDTDGAERVWEHAVGVTRNTAMRDGLLRRAQRRAGDSG